MLKPPLIYSSLPERLDGKNWTALPLSQKLTGFVFNIPMIIALLYMGFVTSQYINWN
jgi:hypothetical protein